jgi:hypothetical protein
MSALSVRELDHRGVASHEVYTAGFYKGDRDFAVRAVLGKCTRGGADVGEVLATIAQVPETDGEGWFTAWVALADRIAGIAAASAERGHRVSAARAYLRASNYYGVAINGVDGLEDTSPLVPTFRAQRAAWDGFVANTRWPVERVDIPYEGSSMPGWFFRPDDSGAARPTLVMNNGSDEAISGAWGEGSEGALERGYNVLVFDGPGQQSMLFERGIPFRYDWEAVLGPVVDLLVARDDVDADRIALYGVSQAGYWVPRALAFEHRFAAAIVDGGVVDVARSWSQHIPHVLRAAYEKGEKERFDKEMAVAMRLRPGARQTWGFRARPYGVTGFSAVLDAVSRYTVEDVAEKITTPLLITEPDGEQFFPGQSAELAALVPDATLVRFTQEEGASYHCQPLARELTEQRMFDWLDERIR